MSLSKLPHSPLNRIVSFLDKPSRLNLVTAAEKSELEVTLKELSRTKKYMCPQCINESGTNKMMQLCKMNEDETQIYKNGYLATLRKFNFFAQFRFSDTGNSNYKWERLNPDDVNSQVQIRNCWNKLEDYEKTLYVGIYHWRERKDAWKCDYVKLLLNFDKDPKCKADIQQKLINMFFGGELNGALFKSELKTFTKDELLHHLKAEHFSDRVMNARVKNRFDWYLQLMHCNQAVDIPQNIISRGGNVDMYDLETFLMDTVVARYLGAERNEMELTAQGLQDQRNFMWDEIKFIYKLIKSTFEDLRYPCRPISNDHISLFKMYDLINFTLDVAI